MGKKYLSLFLAFLLLAVGVFPSQLSLNTYAAGADVTALIADKVVVVKQNGTVISENGTLDFEENIDVRFEFRVPVIGDGLSDPHIVHQGDTASFLIAEGFSLQSAASFDLQFNSVKAGTLTINNVAPNNDVEPNKLYAHILFDGAEDVFDGGVNEVNCYFEASLKYTDHTSGSTDQDYNITILNKAYTIHVPALPVVVTGEKEGIKNGEFIDWTVKVEAKQATDQVDLSGFSFSDNLANVGSLVGTFKMGNTADGVGAVDLAPQPTLDGSTYSTTFGAGTIGPKYLFFRTAIAQDLVSNGNRIITNTARILKDDVVQLTISDSVTFPNQWIEKSAGTITVNKDDPANHVGRITWKIIVNHMEATLPNAIVTDVLDSKLQWESARWTTWNSVTGDWEALYTNIPAEPINGEYALSNDTIGGIPHLTKKAILEITALVKPEYNVGHDVQTINNSATLSWDAMVGSSGIGSGNKQANIGMYPIVKSGGTYNPVTHEVPWSVTVKASDVNADLRVLDLLVYDTTFNVANVATIEGNPAAGSLLHISAADLQKLTPSYSQKYKTTSFAGTNLKLTVYPLKNASGNTIAEVLLITENTEGGIDVSGGDRAFTYNTVVTNPAIYAANGSNTVRNYASLFSASIELNERSASVTAASTMTSKNMLTATNASDVHTNRNSTAATNATGFNYIDKSVVFRLYVNRNGISNLTGDLTTDVTKSLGTITVTDTLPAGWEFIDIAPGKPFYLYEGERTVNGGTVTITAKETEISGTLPGFSSDFSLSGKASFEFQAMEQPYVIYVKARPTTGTQAQYFSSNLVTNVTNTLNFKSVNWSGHSTTTPVQITSQIMDKTYTLSNPVNGLVSWKIDYKPYELNPANPLGSNLRIEDTLPLGMDLILDANGNLDVVASQITVHELDLQLNGTYTVGSVVPLTLGDNLEYDFATRVLTYKIPNSAPEKGYRLSYLTEINGNPGATLTNTVKLIGTDFSQVNTNRPYTVAAADAGATMVRSGWVEITKVSNGTPLSGAKFAITTLDGTRVLRSGTTAGDGKLILRGLPAGDYLLKETEAPAGYVLSTREYALKVVKSGDVSTTSIDGKSGADSHKITVENHATGATGHLKIEKKVAGNLGDQTKAFSFSLEVEGATGAYAIKRIAANGLVTFGELTFVGEKATIQLKHNESLELQNIPVNADYIITEDATTLSGHMPTPSGDSVEKTGNIASGIIAADTTKTVIFTNYKQSVPDVPETTQPVTQPKTETSTEPTTGVPAQPTTEPTVQSTTEVTIVDQPKEGKVPVTEGGIPEVKKPPKNGEVIIKEDGSWTYTPDPGFKGTDQFEIVIINPDGDEEIYLIDLEIEDVPLGPGSPEKLPQTGQASLVWMTWIGALITALGVFLKIKR